MPSLTLLNMFAIREIRLEKIGAEVHPWEYDQDKGEQIDIILDNAATDVELIKHFSK